MKIKWEPWTTEHTLGHLPTHVRKGRAQDGRLVEIYMSRGDESRWCRTWHIGIRINGVLIHQSGMHTAEDKRSAKSDLVHMACSWADAELDPRKGSAL